MIYDFLQRKVMRARAQIMSSATDLREQLPKHMSVPSKKYFLWSTSQKLTREYNEHAAIHREYTII